MAYIRSVMDRSRAERTDGVRLMNPLLAISDLSVTFATDRGQVQALDGVSLSLNAGETLAVVGESGSGKSVTALSIMGLLGDSGRVSDGSIEFDGEDLTKVSGQRLREIRGNQIAFIFQEPMSSLNPVLTIGTQVAEPIWLHHKKSWSEAFEQAGELLQRVAIPDAVKRLEDYPHQFSGGMRQRVMIAIALSCNPKLLFADEPTTALDVTVQKEILELLMSLKLKKDLSILFIISSLVINGCTSSQANEEFPELIFRNQPELLGITLGFGSFSFKLPKTYDQLDTLEFDRLKEVLSDSANSFFDNELLAAFTDEDISILLISKVNTKDALLKLVSHLNSL